MAKWQNKGHEFDKLGEIFQKNKKILVLGENINSVCKIADKLQFVNLDNNVEKKVVNGIFLKLFKIFGTILTGSNVTIVVADDSDKIASKLLKNNHFKKNINLFSEKDFFSRYLSIYALYAADKTYSESQCIIVTTLCTLNCKHCLNFNPYIKDKCHNDINEIKKSIDTYFKAFDRCGLFHLSGGETFMYQKCSELIRYIYDNYKEKIDELGASSNLVVKLSDELCQTLHDCNVVLFVDDYTDQIDDKKIALFNESFEKLKKFKVNCVINKGTELRWFSIFPPIKDDSLLNASDLTKKYDACGYRNSEVRNGYMNNCNYSSFAQRAGIIDQDYSEWYNLNTYTKDKKFELIEYRLGYSEKGYTDFCKYCNGYITINPDNFVPVGGQIDGTLSWNKENPLEIIYDKQGAEV